MIDQDLPDELLQDAQAQSQAEQEILHNLGKVLAEKRDEAVRARSKSGIERIWLECEEAYLCIDEHNRDKYGSAKWTKPMSMSGPVTTTDSRSQPAHGSTVYVRMTARYVDMAAAKVAEMLLPIDDKPFSLKNSPNPELTAALESDEPVVGPGGMQMVMPPAAPPQPGQPPQPPQQMKVSDFAKLKQDKAAKAAEKAEQRIYDWMIESRHPAEMRKVIHDAARIGVGVLKGPYPDVRESKALQMQDGVAALEIIRKVVPSEKWIDPWNLFPHPACNEDIHTGDWIFERDFVSAAQLKRLREQDGYLPDAIDQVLEEGPGKCKEDGRNPSDQVNEDRYEIWYFTGSIKRKEFELADRTGAADVIGDEQDEVKVVATIVNDSVIRVTQNLLESGTFPYHVMCWSRRAGSWAGVGVAEQVSMPQKMINAATRALLNNAGKSSGAQVVVDTGAIVPADNNWTVTPDKLWYKSPDSTSDDVRKAFEVYTFPNTTPQLQSIIQYAFKLAEEACNIPLISQGQRPEDQRGPETFGAEELRNTNAESLLRQIAYTFDDSINEPLVKAYYEWLLLDPEVPAEEKGDFEVNAQGSIALVEKAIQENTILQMGQMVLNPAFKVNPEKWFAEAMRAKRLDPRRIQYTDEEWQQVQSRMVPPEAPAVTAAKIRAQAQLQSAQMDTQASVQKMQVDMDRDRAYVESQQRRDEATHQAKMAELQIKREIAMLEYANQRQITLEQLKVDLAKKTMDINLTKELAAFEAGADRLPKPPVEPPGRAAPGHSFTQ